MINNNWYYEEDESGDIDDPGYDTCVDYELCDEPTDEELEEMEEETND